MSASEVLAQVRGQINYQALYTEYCGELKGSGEWRDALCQFHDDHKPSMGVNIIHGGFHCRVCKRKGDIVHFLREVNQASFFEVVEELRRRAGMIDSSPQAQPRPAPPVPPIPPELAEAFHGQLMRDPARLSYLTDMRGLSLDIIREHLIGFDGRRYTIPIADENGEWRNIRRYDPDASGGNKMISWRTGYGKARLYPIGPLLQASPGDEVFIFEGEWDCLLGRSRGLEAFTVTGGAGTWREGWNVLFSGLNVVICYDADDAGRDGARKVAESLA